MKILHITSDDCGGAGLCCLRIHNSLLEIGVESKVVTLHNTQHALGEYGYGYLKDRLSKIPSKLIRMMGFTVTERNKIIELSAQYGGTYSLPRSAVNLLNCKWTEWADIIHLHWVNNYLDYQSFLKGVSKPVVWTLHDENFFYGIAHYPDTLIPNHPLEKKYAIIKCEAFSYVKRMGVVLLSEYLKKKYLGNSILRGREVRVINNPVDTKSFKPIDKKDARKRLGLSEKDFIIGFTANQIFNERKGLKVLLQVLKEIEIRDKRKLKVLAIGSNSQNTSLPGLISVGVIKGASAMSELLSAVDIFAMPSYQEAFAQSPMEAMACGLPVVVFPVSGTSELVNERNGVVCEDFTPEALKQGIETVMSRKYDSNEIRQGMIDFFSPRRIALQYVDLYKAL